MSKNIIIAGDITCEPADLALVLRVLPDHIRLTREEAGCIHFNINQSPDNECSFIVDELFVDRAAFDAHGVRTRASTWWNETQHIPRNLTVSEE